MTLKQDILNLITERRWVSFAELANHIPGFKGDLILLFPATERYSNICLWSGISDAAAHAIADLQETKAIHPSPSCAMTYLLDGGLLKMPIAKSFRHYKKMHWLPVVFNPGPFPPEKRERRSKP